MNTLKPVRTRDDCINWLTLEEVEKEVFGAFVGAQSHLRNWDFEKDAAAQGPDSVLEPGTVVNAVDGEPWQDRPAFLEYMVTGIAWRLQQLAERKGVDMTNWIGNLGEALVGPSGCSTVAEKLSHPYWKSLGGEVKTIGDFDIDALPPAQRKALKAAIKAGKPVTLPKGALGAV